MKHCVIIGFKSSGKTTLGREAAQALGYPFVDTDDLLGECPATLYRRVGDAPFRDRETEVLHSLKRLPPHIVATGGGIVDKEEHHALLRDLGVVIYLYVSHEVIWERMTAARLPVFLEGPFPRQRCAELYQRRLALYTQVAHYTVHDRDELWDVIRSVPSFASRPGENRTGLL